MAKAKQDSEAGVLSNEQLLAAGASSRGGAEGRRARGCRKAAVELEELAHQPPRSRGTP
jgi:hypothetical protein